MTIYLLQFYGIYKIGFVFKHSFFVGWIWYLSTLFFCRMDIDYSPFGREFVIGSYDRTIIPLHKTSNTFSFSVAQQN